MAKRSDVPALAADLARHQGGVLSRAQLVGLGVSGSTVARARRNWTPLGPGVYWLAPPIMEPPFLARVWAGILLGGEGARAGLDTAAVLHGLAHADEITSYHWRRTLGLGDERICIVTPNDRRSNGCVMFVRERPGERLPSRPADPARTGVDDTALDLAARGSRVQVVTWITRAVQRRLTTPDRLARRLAARPALRHRRIMIDLISEVSEGATTALEVAAVRNVLRPHGLPKFELQAHVWPGLVDVLYRRYRLVIELDGRLGHEAGKFRDRRRDNRHSHLDARSLRYGWEEVVGDPCGVAHEIAQMLHRQGWQGEMSPCPRCALAPLGD